MKEHREEFLSFIEDSIKFAVESLKEILKKSLSPAELQKEMDNFQKGQMENEQLGAELESEIERISNIPGAQEYMESLKDEMEKRLEPHAQELAKAMLGLMAGMMGELMGGLGDMLNEAFSEEAEGNVDSEEDEDE